MLINNVNIPLYIRKIMKNLESNGFEVFVVGGCVRDCLRGCNPTDWDLCTSATPAEMIEVFKEYKIILTGLKHGTVMPEVDGKCVEITTFRTDGEYSDFRHPNEVKYVKTIDEDLKRRDFTINSIAYNDKYGLIDLFNGQADINDRIIRCVGDPYTRFTEDALRILRALRFAATLDFKIDKTTERAILDSSNRISQISSERILNEVKKIVLSSNACTIFQKYINIFENIFNVNLNNNNIALMNKMPNDLSMRMAVLLYDYEPKEICDVLKSLKFDKKTIKEVKLYTSLKIESPTTDRIECKMFLNRYNDANVEKCIEFLKFADNKKGFMWEESKKVIDDIINNKECFSVQQLNITGNDIKNLGYKGIEIGNILTSLVNSVIYNKVENKRDELLSFITENHKS